MRRTLSHCRSGLAAAAAVVLLTACGGSDEDTNASDSSPSPSSSTSASETTENTAPQADSEFCTGAAAIQERVQASLVDPNTADLGAIFTQAAEEIRAIEPPADIADDWEQFAAGIEEFAAISQIDFEDPNAYAQWQAQAGEIQTEYGAAFTSVQTYLATECGLTDEGPTESASPTS
jgi:hypothetical protein